MINTRLISHVIRSLKFEKLVRIKTKTVLSGLADDDY